MNDEVIKVFNDRNIRKSSTQKNIKKKERKEGGKEGRKKEGLFCLNDEKGQIIVEEAKQVLANDTGDIIEDPYTSVVKLLPLNDCQFALYDATYKTRV